MKLSNPNFSLFEEDIYLWKIKYELVFIYFKLKETNLLKTMIDDLLKGQSSSGSIRISESFIQQTILAFV